MKNPQIPITKYFLKCAIYWYVVVFVQQSSASKMIAILEAKHKRMPKHQKIMNGQNSG